MANCVAQFVFPKSREQRCAAAAASAIYRALMLLLTRTNKCNFSITRIAICNIKTLAFTAARFSAHEESENQQLPCISHPSEIMASIERNKMSDTNGTPSANPLDDHDYCSPSKNSITCQNPPPLVSSNRITGEERLNSAPPEHLPEPREKRQRKEVHDPEFSHYTESDYSSSDAESGQESEEYDEDDPNRPWCKCNRPDDGLFMISCDICEYWFHGSCVGVVKSLSERWHKEGKEWFCPECEEALQNGTPRSAIPPKVVKKSKKSSKASGKRRGRPRKSAVQAREASARASLRSTRKMNNLSDSRMSSRKSSTKSTGSESFNEFEHPDRLKELIRERRKAFFLKHRLSEQIKAEKMKELGVGRRSVTASLGDSLDSLVSSTNSPNMNNLPINIKSEHKERSKPNIVLQINTKKDSSSESGSQRLVTTIVKKRKHSEVSQSVKDTPTEPAPVSLVDPLALLDATKDHKNHVFDIGCKVCTKQQSEEQDEPTEQPADTETNGQSETEQEKAQDQPKRLTISIDTKLDPVNLSRLREPLIKPTEQPVEAVEFTLSNASPNADPAAWHKDEAGDVEGDDAEDELYDPETSTIPSSDKNEFEPPRAPRGVCWSGTIYMQDSGKFDASAKPISGSADFIHEKLSQTLKVCGRIAPDQVTSYIKKVKSTTKNQILLLQLYPLTENDKSSFDTFFDYLYTRNRCAVINCSANSQVLKDFYILPIHGKSSIPDVLKPINGPGLDRTVPNCLLGLLVKTKKPQPTPGSTMPVANYTPTPIN